MSATSDNPYLASEVLTATPQKRHLLLLDAAARFARQGQELRRQGMAIAARKQIARAEHIMGELACVLDPPMAAELVRKVAAIYRFIIDALSAAALQDDDQRLAEALRLLDHERETWRQLCLRLVESAPQQATVRDAETGFSAEA